ncbi:hypothetical protein GCM10023148_49360 [Actinokineospora soli]
MNAPHGTPDDDPFATGGHGRFLDGGIAPPVIGATPTDDVEETVRAQPQRYDREPPTSPIPAQGQGAEKKPGFFGRLFGR